jgi:hypothetical protein
VIILFNLRGVAFAAAGLATWLGLLALGVPMLAGALAGAAITAGLDIASRRRARRGLFDVAAGGIIAVVPVWIVARAGVLAALLIATALPADWDRRHRGGDAGAGVVGHGR